MTSAADRKEKDTRPEDDRIRPLRTTSDTEYAGAEVSAHPHAKRHAVHPANDAVTLTACPGWAVGGLRVATVMEARRLAASVHPGASVMVKEFVWGTQRATAGVATGGVPTSD